MFSICSTKLIVYMPVKKPGHVKNCGSALSRTVLTDPHDIGSHCLKAFTLAQDR